MLRPTSCALLLTTLAACSHPQGSGSTNVVDGNYRGRPDLQAAAPVNCPSPRYGFIELGDRELHLAYLPNVVFDAPVQPTGDLHDQQDSAVLDGKVVDNRLIFTVTTPECKTSYNLRFFWNHS